MTTATVVVLCGPPGAGKTTLAAGILCQNPTWAFVSTDGIRTERGVTELREVFDLTYELLRDNLAVGTSIVYEATNTDPDHRRRLVAKLRSWGAERVDARALAVDLAVCIGRNARRDSPTPEAEVRSLHHSWITAPPSTTEGFDTVRWHGADGRLNEVDPPERLR